MWIFDSLFDLLQEENGFSSVNQSMVVCQSHVHHRPHFDLHSVCVCVCVCGEKEGGRERESV